MCSIPLKRRPVLRHNLPMSQAGPRILVFSSLFPSAEAPTAGVFIRERMFRVAKHLPLVVVAPQAWSPFDWIIRRFRKGYRAQAPGHEVMDGVPVNRPRVLSFPGIFKRWDGWLMARGCRSLMRQLQAEFQPDVIDAHFLYPDGYAASLLAAEFDLPLTITIRGSKDEWLIGTDREPMLRAAMQSATRLIAVSQALKDSVAVKLGIDAAKVAVIGNGVDLDKFHPVGKLEARRRLGVEPDATVLIGVGNLIPTKGFHRIIPLLPSLRSEHAGLVYLIVGDSATHSDMRLTLEALAREHGVEDVVRFCGRQPHDELKWYYGAADLFAQATEFEGWSNVFLEAMGCGLPVITTRVGGNAEVVAEPAVGELVDYWNPAAFGEAISRALSREWDREEIIAYARSNTWDHKINRLTALFSDLARE